MRLARHRREGRERFAAVQGDLLVDLRGVDALTEVIAQWLHDGPRGLEVDGEATPLEQAELLAPIGAPVRNLFCVGWNYRGHFDEGEHEAARPSEPVFFTKATTTVNDPYATIPAHEEVTSQLDWEVELAVVLGIGGSYISTDRALSHVFGYTVANDVSARDVQLRAGQWFRGKSLDRTCPIGPWIVTADEFGDPQDHELSSRVNGVEKQRSTTRLMEFTVAHLVAALSRGLTLLPGDVILTGTPEGVGLHRDPPEFLRPGDVVEVSVGGIGGLRNTVASEQGVAGAAAGLDTQVEEK
jgi:2,4-didehydro-3-deoxy-L-rhamnonate hydrolase